MQTLLKKDHKFKKRKRCLSCNEIIYNRKKNAKRCKECARKYADESVKKWREEHRTCQKNYQSGSKKKSSER
jgi:hypothetical protein